MKVPLFDGTTFWWFLLNTLILGLLNAWLQTLQATINGTIVSRWIFMFVV